jgi:hypothetical protein
MGVSYGTPIRPETRPACVGCVGRGTGDGCCMCGGPIPAALRRRPGSPPEYSSGCADCANGRIHSHPITAAGYDAPPATVRAGNEGGNAG